MTDGICCESQAAMSPRNISPPASYCTPTITVNKMHSRRGHTSKQFCFPHVSLKFPTHPLKLVSISVCSFVCVPSFPSFIFSIASLCFVFLFLLPPLSLLFSRPLRLTTTCITLHYNSSTICRAERKTTPHLLFCRSISLFLALSPSRTIFFSLSLQLNHKTSGPKTVNCLETQYGLHPGDYTVNSARLH